MKPKSPVLKQSPIIQLQDLKIIGFTGHAGAGKDTAANYLAERYEYTYIEHFADTLKSAAATMFGIPEDKFYGAEKEQEIEFWKDFAPLDTPRKIAQYFGTEMVRNLIGPNFWIKRLEGRLTNQLLGPDDGHYVPGNCVLIPDVRFQNELDWIYMNNGTIIHLTRDSADGNIGIPNHESEKGIHTYVNQPGDKYYAVSNNSTVEELYTQVETLFNHILSR